MRKFGYIVGICIVLVGCGIKKDPDEFGSAALEPVTIEASEDKETTFFPTGSSFELSAAAILKLKKILRTAKSTGKNNVSFMLMSNVPISEEKKEKAAEKIRASMYECGFVDSRIVDAGAVMYDDAKVGIRIDTLHYRVKDVDVSPWDTPVGDADIYKNIPKYGAAVAYNLREMIVNKADFVNPRKYKGQKVTDAIDASNKQLDSSSSESSSGS